MSQMVRKQIYIRKRQETMLKRLARARGVSEAELIREAIDRQLSGRFTRAGQPDVAALDKAFRFMQARRMRPAGKPYRWQREDAYEERLGRQARR